MCLYVTDVCEVAHSLIRAILSKTLAGRFSLKGREEGVSNYNTLQIFHRKLATRIRAFMHMGASINDIRTDFLTPLVRILTNL